MGDIKVVKSKDVLLPEDLLSIRGGLNENLVAEESSECGNFCLINLCKDNASNPKPPSGK